MDLTIDGSAEGATRRKYTGRVAKRILVAEDDDDTREFVVSGLLEDGHEVIGVGDGAQLAECLDIIARDSLRPPDLIAMDHHMPGRTGLELLEELRTSGVTTPVVVMTAFLSRDVRARVERAGRAAAIAKPYNLLELRAAALRASATKKPSSGPAPY